MGPPSKYETSNRLKFDEMTLTLRDHRGCGGGADGRNALLRTILWLDRELLRILSWMVVCVVVMGMREEIARESFLPVDELAWIEVIA